MDGPGGFQHSQPRPTETIPARAVATQQRTESEDPMTADFRIESSLPISSRWLPASGAQQYLLSDRALAVAVASKATTRARGSESTAEIRVVHVPTGEVVFRKPSAPRAEWAED
jgi:hypothetical protein